METASKQGNPIDAIDWLKIIKPYQVPDQRKSTLQLLTSIPPYLLLVVLLYLSRQYSPYWVTLLLSIPTTLFIARIFMFLHDCGHGAFFKSRRLNNFWGVICGIPLGIPYLQWRKIHAVHHAIIGDLDRRHRLTIVEEYPLHTVDEFYSFPRWKQLQYRIFRHPLLLFTVAPLFIFGLAYRIPSVMVWTQKMEREMKSVIITDLAIIAFLVLISQTMGLGEFALMYLPSYWMAVILGFWLFWVQHQFEETYWERAEGWNYLTAALTGSSFYKLPRILDWFTASIGYHHIHHLASQIPNYNLRACMDENADLFADVPSYNIPESLKMVKHHLWDEEQKRLLTFREAARLYHPKRGTMRKTPTGQSTTR